MKFLFFLLISACFSTSSSAQASWKIRLNDTTVLSTTSENEEKNTIYLKPHQLKKKKDLLLTYTSTERKKEWERTMMVYNEKDQELVSKKGNELKIKNSELLSFFKRSKQIKIYTIAVPTDPKLKASIRVRRVHLCTLVLH